ncbi:uncharacterized protein LOC114364381 [Ostrinia furnacalis]|uniref:uncharacterized protein LOC114364381 n=1 Tax=Ostrinia furnacalis TaxID=93504 RepID=UPI00103E32FF|nr:uncharacterized protein LOC114364381 [Ostrinia furnacalis]
MIDVQTKGERQPYPVGDEKRKVVSRRPLDQKERGAPSATRRTGQRQKVKNKKRTCVNRHRSARSHGPGLHGTAAARAVEDLRRMEWRDRRPARRSGAETAPATLYRPRECVAS